MTEVIEEEELARISMQWPKELKERVRDVAGHRGMTEFVIDAVLERLGPEELEDPEEVVDFVRCPQHGDRHAPGQECPKCRLEKRAQENEAEEGPAPVAPTEQVSTPLRVESGDDHLAKVMEMARQKGVELGSINLTPASEIVKPEPKPKPEEIATEDRCSTCGSELIDGECWSCE